MVQSYQQELGGGCPTGFIALERRGRGAPFGAHRCELLESLIAPIALLDAGPRMMLDVAIKHGARSGEQHLSEGALPIAPSSPPG
jgi:hypothetical protein